MSNTQEPSLRRWKGFIFDLDGTIYLGERLIPGADEAVRRVRALGGKTIFLSNKAIAPARSYVAKLNRLGIPARDDEVISSSQALARLLTQRSPGARVYVVGEQPLRDELLAAGLRLRDDERAVDWVVLSFDRTFHYGKLRFAMEAVRHGARLCATNPDRTCPFDGYELPDAAGMIAAVEAVTGAKLEFVAGKPSPLFLQAAMTRMGCRPEECLIIGDRLDTDIVMGKEAGLTTALVLTGVTSREMLAASRTRPDYLLASVADLLAWA